MRNFSLDQQPSRNFEEIDKSTSISAIHLSSFIPCNLHTKLKFRASWNTGKAVLLLIMTAYGETEV
jgi:hypothetical protein